jgi:hypothetical protein
LFDAISEIQNNILVFPQTLREGADMKDINLLWNSNKSVVLSIKIEGCSIKTYMAPSDGTFILNHFHGLPRDRKSLSSTEYITGSVSLHSVIMSATHEKLVSSPLLRDCKFMSFDNK